MNKEQKAAVVEEVAAELREAQAVYAIDYRGISVPQAAELRSSLRDAGASFRIVKNRLTARAAEQAGAEPLKELLDGPTALTLVRGDAALAAKAIAAFQRQHDLLEIKGGLMDGGALSAGEIEEIARLPGREQLQAQLVGVLASPITGLVRGLGSLIQGLAIQLEQIREQGLVGGADTPPPATQDAAGEEGAGAAVGGTAETPQESSEAPGDPVAEAEAAEAETSEDKET